MEDQGRVVRLPLWESCLEDMIKDGIFHGKTYTIEWFEGKLREKRDSVRFGMDIHKIRVALEEKAFCLSGQGTSKTGLYIIQEANRNIKTMSRMSTRARRATERALAIGSSTATLVDLLTPAEIMVLEQRVEREALKLLFMRKPEMDRKALGVEKMESLKGPKRLKAENG